MSSAHRPQEVFGIGGIQVGEAGLALQQRVHAGLVDHRGVLEMPAYAVLAESVTSGVYWYSFPESVATVQAWLAMTAGRPAGIGDTLRAAAQLSHRDERYGTATVTVRNQSDDTVCTGVARAARVGRTTPELQGIDRRQLSVQDGPVPARPQSAPAVAPLDPGWDGRRILTAITAGEISGGPLGDLLAMTIIDCAGDPVLALAPQPWMANPLGAIQGGVIAAIVGHACSLAGQAHTRPGDRHTLADLCIFYFRSPPVDRGPLTLITRTDRAGGRLASVTATLTDATGERYARAVADIAYERADAF